MTTKTKAPKGAPILNANGEPVASPQAPSQTIVPARRLPNPDHEKYPDTIGPFGFVRVTAAGSGDSIYLNTREIMAIEINSETSACQFVLKGGAVLPVIEDPHVLVSRLVG